MNLLLDTHIFLWFVNDDPKLSAPLKDLIEDENNFSYLSVASLWEMSIKYNLGKLTLAPSYQEFVDKLPKVSEFDAQAIGPETKPNGKTEESLKPTQQETNTDIISSKVSEFHSESELETVVETSKDAENSQENLEVIEPETQIELEATKVSEEKTELTPSQVRETSPDDPKAEENVGVIEPETQIGSKSVEVLEKKAT
ncbi:conserved hypothetical protein (plasmid) [Gloeothece citriformis PCC 7424]|uniref:PilT protein domain protein n=1 Tax=Gloeothece citriformis (strain PCC 7424) TaxID=65393 RepID=B7KMD7_GLOC7|nr:type II toxin-antitoxin system VapC family toxin [Gloeothece citriformis]ACK73959.1 conserved hypothetical protein [Gloeothece citriformis PCC 7424]